MKHRYLTTLCVSLIASTASATAIFVEDFEDSAVTYTLADANADPLAEFSDTFGDFFTRTDGTNVGDGGSFYSVSGVAGSFYFAGMDLDGEGDPEPFTQLFSGIDISGATDLEFSVLLAEDDDGSSQDWDENDDIVSFAYQIDGGGFLSLFDVLPSGTGFNSEPAVDGTAVTSAFAEFSESIAGTGSTLDILITWDLDSGDEDLAIDNVTISGSVIPEPGSALLVLLGATFAGAAGRRSRLG